MFEDETMKFIILAHIFLRFNQDYNLEVILTQLYLYTSI